MKEVKTFYLTKEFIQKELGIEKVEVAYAPVTVVNNKALVDDFNDAERFVARLFV